MRGNAMQSTVDVISYLSECSKTTDKLIYRGNSRRQLYN